VNEVSRNVHLGLKKYGSLCQERIKTETAERRPKIGRSGEHFNEKSIKFSSFFHSQPGRNYSFFFSPVTLVCQQLQRPVLKSKQKRRARTTFPVVSASGGFALSCEHEPVSYSASLFLHPFVYCISEWRLIIFFFPSRSDHLEWP